MGIICLTCGRSFTAKKSNARTCSMKCRKRLSRATIARNRVSDIIAKRKHRKRVQARPQFKQFM